MIDVITIGETMVRLSTINYRTLEQSGMLDFSVAGSESSVAISLSRLGIKTAWISKLVDDPLGRKIVQNIQSHGVDTSKVVWTQKGRIGIYFIEYGVTPRSTKIVYDRKNSAINSLKPEEIDWNCFNDVKLVHLSGITAALSKNCAELVKKTIFEARKKRKKTVSFDLNYRSRLWGVRKARIFFEKVLPNIDILIAAKRDIEMVFGMKISVESMFQKIKEMFGNKIIVITAGSNGAFAHDGKIYHCKAYKTFEVDRIGAGDAFTAGFIYGYLIKKDTISALSYGNAMAALKYTMPGDIPYITRNDIENLILKGSCSIER
ncbi:MAG: sugar kinase [Candidatus Omnitrophica bacterium]|nr:sugar kinase [Candidatus Omnitrophota bacterium]MCM8828546.1 sugar kinase [Candidatus Omnitrophota bacterium]